MTDSLLLKRRSKRAYADRPIPPEVLNRVIEKTRWSPSCLNNQPWRFVFVSERSRHAALVAALASGNHWAARAPVLVVGCAREEDDYTRNDDPVAYYQFDCGLAVMGLLLAAVEEHLMGHPMAGYDAAAIHEVLDIPPEWHVMCVISLGYEGSVDDLDKRARASDEAPRQRKAVNEIVSFDRFEF